MVIGQTLSPGKFYSWKWELLISKSSINTNKKDLRNLIVWLRETRSFYIWSLQHPRSVKNFPGVSRSLRVSPISSATAKSRFLLYVTGSHPINASNENIEFGSDILHNAAAYSFNDLLFVLLFSAYIISFVIFGDNFGTRCSMTGLMLWKQLLSLTLTA